MWDVLHASQDAVTVGVQYCGFGRVLFYNTTVVTRKRKGKKVRSGLFALVWVVCIKYSDGVRDDRCDLNISLKFVDVAFCTNLHCMYCTVTAVGLKFLR